jgi:4-amino-4-deoxy-L-arabinose transferase-like glycosyltransferase
VPDSPSFSEVSRGESPVLSPQRLAGPPGPVPTLRWLQLALFLWAFGSLFTTSGDYGLTWDEPTYIESAERLSGWFAEVGSGAIRSAFREERLKEAWVFARRDNRNLPAPVLLSLAGHVFGWGLPPPASYRLGVCALMGGTVAILFGSLARRKGLLTGLVGAGALLLNPPLFAHAHIAATDTPVSSFLLLTLLLWLESAERPRLLWLGGLTGGLGLASKASFAIVPMVLLLWLALFGDRSAWLRGLRLALLSALAMLLLCPMWWGHPLGGPFAYLARVAHAGERWQVDAFYLGKASTETLPWHSGFVLAAVTTPPLTLLLATLGGFFGVKRKDPEAVLWLLAGLALPLARLLPSAPGHDGARLLMPSLYCLAPLAGLGFLEASRLLSRTAWRAVALVCVLGLPARAILLMHPYEMSYYSECIGGLPGAERLGFEVSYWFDAFTPEAREAVQALLPRSARVSTAPRYTGYPLLRQWHLWRADLQDDEEDPQYVILYSRKGYFTQVPRLAELAERAMPIWALRFQGVPLVRLYRLEARPVLASPPP